MKHCEAMSYLISESQDRALTMVEKFRLSTHLMMCQQCKNYQDSVKQLRVIMKHYADKPNLQGNSERPDPRQV